MSGPRGILVLSHDLHQETARNAARMRAELLHLLAEIAEHPPTTARLAAWLDTLKSLTEIPVRLQPLLEMLRNALHGTLTSKSKFRKVWFEYKHMMLPNGKTFVQPYASAHCSAEVNARVNSEPCPFEKGKTCPFGDFYCVNRFGAPCDHLAASLELASRHLRDCSVSGTRAQWRRTVRRFRRLVSENLGLWVPHTAQVLFMRAQTPLYQAEALAIDAVIRFS